MPFFRFPFFYNPSYYNRYTNYGEKSLNKTNFNNYKLSNNINTIDNPSTNFNTNNSLRTSTPNYEANDTTPKTHKKNNSKSINDTYFFELFGLKLYFDDVLLICLMFFLYNEGVRDNELFLSLILLLLS